MDRVAFAQLTFVAAAWIAAVVAIGALIFFTLRGWKGGAEMESPKFRVFEIDDEVPGSETRQKKS